MKTLKFNDTVRTHNGHNLIVGSVLSVNSGTGQVSISSFKSGKTYTANISRVKKITNKQADLELDRDWHKIA